MLTKNSQTLFIVFDSMSIGGIERKIVDLCAHYSNTNTRVFLLLKNPVGQLLPQISPNTTILSPHFYPPLHNLFFWFWLNLQVKKFNPKLILAYGNFYAIHSLFAKLFFKFTTPIVVSEDSSIDVQLQSDSFSFLRHQLVKLLYPLATNIIVLTHTAKTKLTKIVPSSSSKITILPNWLPYSSTDKISSPKISKDIDILFLSRFEPQKNPLRLLKIIKSLHNHKLKIIMVGQGSLEPKIKKYICKHNLNVAVIPATPNVANFYQRSKIFLMTSIHEGFPLTILESFYHHCQVICPKLSEVIPFFDYYPERMIYQNNSQAIKQIRFFLSQPKVCHNFTHHYRYQIIKNQSTNFHVTLNYLNRYL